MKTDFLKKFRDYFGQLASDKNTLIVLALFLLTFVIKNVMFYYDIDSEDNPYKINATAIALYFFIGLFIASLSLFCKNKYGLTLVSLLYDAWLLSNLWYFRCYNDLLTHWNLQCVGNMDGIWDSVLIYINGADFFYIAISVAFILACVFLKCKAKHTAAAITLATASVLMSLPLINAQVNELKKSPHVEKELTLNIFDENYNIPFYKWESKGNRFYSIKFTPLLHFVNQFENCFSSSYQKIDFSKEDFEKYISKPSDTEPQAEVPNVIVVLFESLEGWTINQKVGEYEITPNLNKLVRSNNVFFTDNMGVQTANGLSSDAQLLLNTGLSPILEGAVANRFFMNEFPSLCEASNLPNRKTFVPTAHTLWNQDKITKAYDYNELFAHVCSDKTLFSNVEKYIDSTVNEGSFVQVATMASHSPFDAFSDSSLLKTSEKALPPMLDKYIKSVNYTDASLALIVEKIMNDDRYANTILVVMGDHAVFPDETRNKFRQFFKLNNFGSGFTELNVGSWHVPFIVYSKKIQDNIYFGGESYQMDTYPTLLSLINKNYYWNGLGLNLLEKRSASRIYSSSEASAISDKLINGNFFHQHKKY
ncbi:MAG: LTA synthase family protein [Paludibacteraceae bacterium]|nr:LTA synthase family protein [Paludibacteraceae bacterium]